jgi:hypothetical protein
VNARKKTPGPDMGGLQDDWNRVAQLRQEEHAPPAPEASSAPAPARKAGPSAAAAKSADPPAMSRRSWYAEQDAVEALAAAVEEVHFATRVPKHTIVSELFRAAAAAAPKVQKKLSHE